MTITLNSRPVNDHPTPRVSTPDAPNSRSAVNTTAPINRPPSGSTSPVASERAAPDVDSPQGTQSTGGQAHLDAHHMPAAGSNVPGPAAVSPSTSDPSSLLDPALCLAADILDDIERVRIANENRLRQLTRSGEDKDGEERGFGLDESHPDVARLAAMVATLKQVEHDATLNLQRKVRKHPLGQWAKGQRGVGEKQIARLLAAVGDPYINSAKGEPRTVSALWAYSGLHVLAGGHLADEAHTSTATGSQLPGGHGAPDARERSAAGVQHRDTDRQPGGDQVTSVGVAAKRRKGERANWSTKAKMRAYLIAESCIKQLSPDCRDGHKATDAQLALAGPVQAGEQVAGQCSGGTQPTTTCACSPYRVVYDTRRVHTATTHPEWTDGHSHNDALRVASKEILKDLWRAAREWHQTEGAA